MRYSAVKLRKIYERTDGRCHICGIKLSFANYGDFSGRAGWEVEHSVPRAKGGTDHENNLFSACISCNRAKGTFTAKTARRWNGSSRAPLSKKQRQRIKAENTGFGAFAGGVLGLPGGPVGVAAGAAIGAWIGRELLDVPR